MSYITEASVRAAAVEYIRRKLGQGKSLAKALLKTLDFGQGQIMTLTASSLNPAETVRFDWGHAPQAEAKPERLKFGDTTYTAFPVANANEQLVGAIYESLQNPESICFLENYLAEAHDPWLRGAKSRVITNGSEVYHALFSADRDTHKIEATIREWHNLPTSVGALGSLNEKASAQVAAAKTITTGELAAFAETARSVFVGAYDGEGYVVWTSSE